jgi:hypothetical protein
MARQQFMIEERLQPLTPLFGPRRKIEIHDASPAAFSFRNERALDFLTRFLDAKP